MSTAPTIAVTVAATRPGPNGDLGRRKNALYAEAVRSHGGEPVMLDAVSTPADREAAFGSMDGLLMSGGVDMDPGHYGQPNRGSVDVQPDRDQLEIEAWAAAAERDLPVMGICRGFQVLNVLLGGTLLQDVGGHAGPGWGNGPAMRHPLRVMPGTRLARILFPSNVGGGVVSVNSFHHQGVRRSDLAPGLVANAIGSSAVGDLVEGLESPAGRFVIGLQCHPERTESTPDEFDRLWRVFVDACRGPAATRSPRSASIGST